MSEPVGSAVDAQGFSQDEVEAESMELEELFGGSYAEVDGTREVKDDVCEVEDDEIAGLVLNEECV